MGNAIFRQRSGILGVGIVSACGIVTPEQLAGLGKLARDVGSVGCKFTTRQTLVVLIPDEKLDALKTGVKKLGLSIGVFGESIRNIKACCGGPEFCDRSQADVISLTEKLQPKYMNEKVPRDFKISFAGCRRGCTDPLCADFGALALSKNSFDIFIGGRGSTTKPIHATKIAEKLSPDGVEEILKFVLEVYRNNAEHGERLCDTIKRVGVENFIPAEDLLAKYRVKPDNDFLEFAGLK